MTLPDTVKIGDVQFGGGHVGWILGPCSLESDTTTHRVSEYIADMATDLGIQVVFKGSFDKANRTRGDSARGPGLDEGLRLLEDVRVRTGLPVITDVHETQQIEPVAAVVDALQIPAFLCRQTDLIANAAATHKPVLIKKGQFLNPGDARFAAEKAQHSDGGVLLGERGSSFGHQDLVVDFRGIVEMRRHAPVIFDGTHSTQHPGALSGESGGDRAYVEPLCRAALAVGVDGLFLETHPRPAEAISDRSIQIPLDSLPELVRRLLPLTGLSERT